MASKTGAGSSRSKKSQNSAKNMTKEEKDKLAAKEQLTREELVKKRVIHDEIIAIILIAIGIFFIVSLQTEAAGALGHFFKTLLFGLFGKVAYAIPYFLLIYSILIFLKKSAYVTIRSWLSILILFFMASAFNASFYQQIEKLDWNTVKTIYEAGQTSGGVIGMALSHWLLGLIGKAGLYIVCIAGIIITLLFIINTPLSELFDNVKIKASARRQAMEERRMEMELENQRKEAEAKLRADMAEREALRAEKESRKKKNEQTVILPAEEFAPKEVSAAEVNDLTKDEETVPKLNTEPLFSFPSVKDIEEDAEPEIEEQAPEEEKVQVPVFTPESIGLKTSQVSQNTQTVQIQPEDDFDDSEFSKNQKQILSYVRKDAVYGLHPGDTTTGLTGTVNVQGEAADETPAVSQKSVDNAVQKHEVITPIKPAAGIQNDRIADAPLTPAEFAASMGKTLKIEEAPKPEYVYPPMSLLAKPSAGQDNGTADLQATAKLLEETMKSFGVNASVVDAVRGPAVTRFEVKPATGVKVSRITSLQDDIALKLAAMSLRIEAPIPGKAAVGIEVSNSKVKPVLLREIIDTEKFRSAKSKISVGLGKSISGEAIVANLKDMPHLLIAGSTGSGKSVCINSILISLLYKAKPSEVKLILVDPKVVELGNYNGIPHLLIPVVTKPEKASAALGWAVSEMEERYAKFAKVGVRDLASYNDYCRADSDPESVLPQIVIVIDELADLIMAAHNQVEDSICRLAQKARAAGMHLIVATQRPSVDVITGVIKANINSRIAFAVSSQIDSRTILDTGGAEKLLGKGDMLYHPQGMSKPLRVQGCFVSDDEVNSVIDFIKKNCGEPAVYSQDIMDIVENSGSAAAGPADESDGGDDLLTDAIECVVRAERCSVSSLQRRFRIGYNRAARLVDMMEERGIVGPAEGSNPRKVIMTVAQFEQLSAEVREGQQFLDEHPEFKEEV